MNSRRILSDPRIFAGCLQLLMNSIQPEKGDKTNETINYYKRIDNVELNNSIINNFKRFFFYPKLPDFEMITSQSIDFLYKMCTSPDVLCQDIIYGLCHKLMEISQKRQERNMEIDEADMDSSQSNQMYIPKYLLPRFIYIFGYVATKELIYLQDDVVNNVKYREELSSQSKNSDQGYGSGGSPNNSSTRLALPNTSDDDDALYMGATAEDHVGELITNICDTELIGSIDGLLHHFVPILNEILSHPAKYTDDYIQRAALLAFIRFMTVSSTYCTEQIAFLMNILRKTKSTSMKCNIIIGLADLTGRYANTIEPWIPNFFVLLLESNDTVRLTTLKMLSYVILQAIIRVTGQISEMAACIIDKNQEIQNTAKEFFRQLICSKELDYYKVMPDIISRLSTNDSPMPEDKFRIVMRYLFELIHKDRPSEILLDKLCHRFRNTNTERQWRDIAFCLSLLNLSEKTMKKLIEHLPNYKDKLQCDEIYDFFKVIISNANKQLIKPGLKDATKEFEAKIQKCMEAGQNNISIDVSSIDINEIEIPSQKKQKAQKTQKTTKKTKKRTRARIISSDEDDDDFEENIPPPQPRRAQKRK